MADLVRITSIQFDKFKALSGHRLHLDHLNVLVGPNNSGKSTIIGSVRALAAAIRIARSRSPERIDLPEGTRIGYRINESILPISLENVHTDYSANDSRVTFTLSNGNRLHLAFPRTDGCFLLPEASGETINSVAKFKRQFPLTLTIVPVLGPVEHREARRERETVLAWLSTHRASRHFRSYWHYFQDEFDDFANLVKQTWPGMEIQRPEITDIATGELSMFCLEDRMTRELYWAGFGFQIWCQLLTHLCRAQDSSLIVIDEPEVYLHPDVQRQLIGLLRELGPDVLLATHSTEMMAEADPSDIVVIDKRRSTFERLKDITGVQRAMDAVGSIQNITLTALARNRRVLFVEGDDDFRLIRRLARRLGFNELGAGFGITPLESGGFGSWQRITTLAQGIGHALGVPLTIGAVYDRDFFCDEEIATVGGELSGTLKLAHIHKRKEIENYLLIPEALDRAIKRAIADRVDRGSPAANNDVPSAAELLLKITDSMRDDVQSQLIARRTTYLRSSGKDFADLTRETLAAFAPRWDTLATRLELVPGKEVLKAFRDKVQTQFSISLTDARIIDAMHRDEIPQDMHLLVSRVDQFRKLPA